MAEKKRRKLTKREEPDVDIQRAIQLHVEARRRMENAEDETEAAKAELIDAFRALKITSVESDYLEGKKVGMTRSERLVTDWAKVRKKVGAAKFDKLLTEPAVVKDKVDNAIKLDLIPGLAQIIAECSDYEYGSYYPTYPQRTFKSADRHKKKSS